MDHSAHADGVIIRLELPGDARSVREVHLAAFPTAEEADLVDRLRLESAWVDELSWVAVDDGRVVGHALLTRCHIGDQRSLALAPVAVVPELHGGGIGTALTAAALEAARVLGESSAVVLGHPGYYPRFGFGTASGHGVTVSFEVPDEALMVMSLDGTPIPAGVVRYAAAFGL